jgi:hypothetical protein
MLRVSAMTVAMVAGALTLATTGYAVASVPVTNPVSTRSADAALAPALPPVGAQARLNLSTLLEFTVGETECVANLTGSTTETVTAHDDARGVASVADRDLTLRGPMTCAAFSPTGGLASGPAGVLGGSVLVREIGSPADGGTLSFDRGRPAGLLQTMSDEVSVTITAPPASGVVTMSSGGRPLVLVTGQPLRLAGTTPAFPPNNVVYRLRHTDALLSTGRHHAVVGQVLALPLTVTAGS